MSKHFIPTILFFVLMAIIILLPVHAVQYKAVGTGKTKAESQEDAMGSLARILYTRVESSYIARQSLEQENGKTKTDTQSVDSSISVTADVPLIGVVFGVPKKDRDGQFVTEAILDSDVSNPMYLRELTTVAKKLEASFSKLTDAAIRKEAAILYDEYERLTLITRILNLEDVPTVSMDRISFLSTMQKYNGTAESLQRAAELISSEITQYGIYVYPVNYQTISGTTEFSFALKQYVSASLGEKVVTTEKEASYYLSGNCFESRKNEDGTVCVDIVYRLIDRNRRVVYASPVVTLLPKAFRNLAYIPDGYDFQKMLPPILVHDQKIQVEIQINGSTDNLTFAEDDDVYINVKASEPCFIYVIGYVFEHESDCKPFAYLYPFDSSNPGKTKFIRKITAQETNKWVCINPSEYGENLGIKIIPPFGTEILQVYAISGANYTDAADCIPAWSETDAYYVVSDNPSEALSTTRGLNAKKKSATAGSHYSAEAYVKYYTHK